MILGDTYVFPKMIWIAKNVSYSFGRQVAKRLVHGIFEVLKK